MTANDNCPHCNHPNRLGAKFCQKCGSGLGPLPVDAIARAENTRQPGEQIASARGTYCIQCKKEVSPGMQFCRHCGADQQAATVHNAGQEGQTRASVAALPRPSGQLSPPPTAMASTPQGGLASTPLQKARSVGGTASGIPRTLMLPGVTPPTPALPSFSPNYQIVQQKSVHNRLPGWIWFLFGLLFGVLLTVAVVRYGATLIDLIRPYIDWFT